MYNISFEVTKEENTLDEENPFDFVDIKLGNNRFLYQPAAIVKNVRAPGQPGIIYKINYKFRGSEIYFQFQFQSNTPITSKHLLIKNGEYIEYKNEPLEYLDGNNRLVLSDYVKEIRMEEAQGRTRITTLMHELLRVKQSEDKVIDSDKLTGIMQRFDRKVLIKFLKRELLLENERDTKEKTDYEQGTEN